MTGTVCKIASASLLQRAAWVAALLVPMGGHAIDAPDGTPRSVYAGEAIATAPHVESRFDSGFAAFVRTWTVAEGLGPSFNARSCAACHHIPIVGGTETAPRAFVARGPAGIVHSSGSDSIPTAGTVSAGPASAGTTSAGASSAGGSLLTRRKPPSLYGLGLLEAVPESFLVQLSDPADRDGNGISGRCAVATSGLCGRFGWKAERPTLDSAVETALRDELGISRDEQPNAIEALSEFVRLLAAPRAVKASEGFEAGRKVFAQAGCASCHVERLPVPPNRSLGIEREIHIRAFTDLLLHDMGEQLAEPIATPDGATSREFRTPPLWGLVSSGPPYLHDGRAQSIREAIDLHGGEAADARARWLKLTEAERMALDEFLAGI